MISSHVLVNSKRLLQLLGLSRECAGYPGVCTLSSGGMVQAQAGMLQPLLYASIPLAAFVLHPFSCSLSLQMEQQLLGGPVCLPALDLEKWYQEVMAGFETSSSSVSPSSSPPPLPAKAHSSHKALQVILATCC